MARPGHAKMCARAASVQVWQQPGGVGRNIAHALAYLLGSQEVHLCTLVGDDPAGGTLRDAWAAVGASTAGWLIASAHVHVSNTSARQHSQCAAAGAARGHPNAADNTAAPQLRSATVCAVLDCTGELRACVADTGACESAEMAAWARMHARHAHQRAAPHGAASSSARSSHVDAFRDRLQQAGQRHERDACQRIAVIDANMPARVMTEIAQAECAAGHFVAVEPVSVAKATR